MTEKKAPAFPKTKAGNRNLQTAETRTPRAAVLSCVDAVLVGDLPRHIEDWLYDCQFRQHSPRTVEFRQHVGDKLRWFLEREQSTQCGLSELRRYLAHVANGHEEPGGRWGNAANKRPTRPATIHRYFRELKTFFAWLVKEGFVDQSPVERITPPSVKAEQIQPYTQEQVQAMLHAARRSTDPHRDEAIVLLLFDTGIRASELCNLKVRDLDIHGRRCTVIGKGNKRRVAFFGRVAGKALWLYLKERARADDEPVFLAKRGREAGSAMTRTGLMRLTNRLGKAAGIKGLNCGVHRFRHTFAVEFLRNGGHVFTLKELMGHEGLAVTIRYVALAQADLESQHRAYSPGDRLKSKP